MVLTSRRLLTVKVIAEAEKQPNPIRDVGVFFQIDEKC